MSRRPKSTAVSQIDLSRKRGVPKATMWSEMPVATIYARVGAVGEETGATTGMAADQPIDPNTGGHHG